MKFLELIKIRQSVRKYSDKPVEKEKIERCIEAARLAPSACNSQPWKYIVIDDPDLKDKDFYLIDIGITAEHFCLQAAEEGLGTCMLGWFNERAVLKLLGVPGKKRIGLLITLGYASDEPRQKKRKEIKEMCNYNKY